MTRKVFTCLASSAVFLLALGHGSVVGVAQQLSDTSTGAPDAQTPVAGVALPKPERIVVERFTVPAEVITTDQSAAARLQQRRNLRRNQPTDASAAAIAQQVEASFTNTLVQELLATQIPVATSEGQDSFVPNKTLIIHGNFTDINQGNRSQRIMIGFGMGASDVRAHVIVSLKTDAQTVVVSEFTTDASSGKKPGAGATMGVGSAATVAAGAATHSTQDKKGLVTAEASSMAKKIAKQIIHVMSSQQWIPANAVAAPEESH